MPDIVVIGDTSFTGKAFIEYAKKQGADVLGMSFRGDLTIPLTKYVVNFAALNVVQASWLHPQDYFRVNVQKVIELANMLRDVPLTKYVHVSTPEVSGSGPQDQYNPSTPYAASRAAAEMVLKTYWQNYGFPVVFTRSANIYGPGQQLYRLIPKAIMHKKLGIPFPLEGGGVTKRSFVYIDDVVKETWDTMIHGQTGSTKHITTRHEYEIWEVVANFIKCDMYSVASRSNQDYEYLLQHDGSYRIPLREGLNRTEAWIDEHFDELKNQPMQYEFRP